VNKNTAPNGASQVTSKKRQSSRQVFREGRHTSICNAYRGVGRVTGSYGELKAHIEALRARDEVKS
jgi:hypothetical protein